MFSSLSVKKQKIDTTHRVYLFKQTNRQTLYLLLLMQDYFNTNINKDHYVQTNQTLFTNITNNSMDMATCSIDQESAHSQDEVEHTSREDASQDYDFVEQLDQDFYCPVSLEILLEPPWKCQHCNFETTYEVGTNDHTPNCTKYPELCPNRCEIGSVPHCDVDKHLLVCPMQLVECEFAQSGCDVKVPRGDLAKHMTENAQHHLMSTTLLNLQLTRELHQKMEEKDQQIVHLQQQVKEMDSKIDAKLETQTKDIATNLQQQTRVIDTKLQQQTRDIDTKLQQQTRDIDTKLQQQTKDLDIKVDTGFKQQAKETSEVSVKVQLTHQQIAKLDQQLNKLHSDLTYLALSSGFTRHEFTLIEFKKHQAEGGDGDWISHKFYNYPGGYCFRLSIFTNGYSEARGTHLTAALYLWPVDNDDKLKWPIKCTMYLQILNQRGDHGHHTGIQTAEFKAKGLGCFIIGTTIKYFPLAKLGYCADQNTEYLKNDCIKFRMYLKVES